MLVSARDRTPLTEPVCGCDDNDYDSVLEATRAGVVVAERGPRDLPSPEPDQP